MPPGTYPFNIVLHWPCSSQKLTDELAQGATVLVTMGCAEACPYVPGLQPLEWLLVDPEGKAREEMRLPGGTCWGRA